MPYNKNVVAVIAHSLARSQDLSRTVSRLRLCRTFVSFDASRLFATPFRLRNYGGKIPAKLRVPSARNTQLPGIQPHSI